MRDSRLKPPPALAQLKRRQLPLNAAEVCAITLVLGCVRSSGLKSPTANPTAERRRRISAMSGNHGVLRLITRSWICSIGGRHACASDPFPNCPAPPSADELSPENRGVRPVSRSGRDLHLDGYGSAFIPAVLRWFHTVVGTIHPHYAICCAADSVELASPEEGIRASPTVLKSISSAPEIHC